MRSVWMAMAMNIAHPSGAVGVDPNGDSPTSHSVLATIDIDDAASVQAAAEADQLVHELGTCTSEEDPGSRSLFDNAELAESVLPASLRHHLLALRHHDVDAVVARGLGPAHGTSGGAEVRQDPSLLGRGRVWTAAAARVLGQEFTYENENRGSLVHNVRPTSAGAQTQSNASWEVDLSFHTENAFHPLRPDFLVLYCVQAPRNPPATGLCPVGPVLLECTDTELGILRQPRFTFRVVESFLAEGADDAQVTTAVVGGSERRPSMRWHRSLCALDPDAERAAATVRNAIPTHGIDVTLHPGDLLAFANDRMLHGRSKFDAALDGADRWLLRSYVTRSPGLMESYCAPRTPFVVRREVR